MAIDRSNRWEATRMQALPFSGIRKVFEAANKLRAQGVEVIDLALGRPDFDTPANIKEAAKTALDKGQVHYTSNYGIPELTSAISKKMKADNNLDYDPKGEIMVTVGACEAVLNVLTSFLNPGDEVIVPSPGWLNYIFVPRMLGATPVTVPLKEENDFCLSAEDVAAKVTDKTKLLVLVSPHNPTGGIVDRKNLEAIAELAKIHDFLILADEVYEKIIYDGNEHISIGSLPNMKERTITINGVSKTYSMTGWRIGWIAADKPLMGSLVRSHQYAVTCATAFAQAGAVEALEGPQNRVHEMVKEFDMRRELVVKSLNELPGVSCVRPSGAFYVFANIKGLGMTSVEASNFFLEKSGVAMVPGSAFGDEGEGFIRVSYCNSYEKIQTGMKRMKEAIEKHK